MFLRQRSVDRYEWARKFMLDRPDATFWQFKFNAEAWTFFDGCSDEEFYKLYDLFGGKENIYEK